MEYLFSCLPHRLCGGEAERFVLEKGSVRAQRTSPTPQLSFRSLIADHSRSRHARHFPLTHAHASRGTRASDTQIHRPIMFRIHSPFRKPRIHEVILPTLHLGSQFWLRSHSIVRQPEETGQRIRGSRTPTGLCLRASGSWKRRPKSTTDRHSTFRQDVASAWFGLTLNVSRQHMACAIAEAHFEEGLHARSSRKP
jgi:hypothetical protein